jgi:predicted Co/Zn/Cd cation transporter (cation efflux family)
VYFALLKADWDLRQNWLQHYQRPMVIAMVAVRMVQMAIDQVIDVIAMRYGLMTAAGPVHV